MINNLLLSSVILVGSIGLVIIVGFIAFGKLLQRLPKDSAVVQFLEHIPSGARLDAWVYCNSLEDYLTRRNEFWTLFGQFVLTAFVIICITILLLTKIISPEAGLPILSGIGGFAIGKGIQTGRSALFRRRQESD